MISFKSIEAGAHLKKAAYNSKTKKEMIHVVYNRWLAFPQKNNNSNLPFIEGLPKLVISLIGFTFIFTFNSHNNV